MQVSARFGAQYHAKAEFFPLSIATPRGPKVAQIVAAVSEITGVSENEIRSDRTKRKITRARHLVCFLARECTSLSYPTIGRLIGRDHSAIMYGCDKIDELRGDPIIEEQIKTIKARFA